jgi:AraC-like DNA-binding protein
MKNIPTRKINAVKNAPPAIGGFSIRAVEDLLNGGDMFHAFHRHDYYLILAVRKGAGCHEIDFVSYEVCDNTVFFLRPGQVHQLILKAGSTGYLMQFNVDFYYPTDNAARQLLRKTTCKNFCQLESPKVEKLFSKLTYIHQEFAEKQEGYLEVINASLGIFLIELVRQRQLAEQPTGKQRLYEQERLDELLELIETNIFKHKQVSDYAGLLNLSPYQLNAITKATTGKTCSELINEHVILETKRYLLSTSNQIAQIADLLGYEDISYFIRFFKKHTGYTPESFRQLFK